LTRFAFTIAATDNTGFAATARLQITVAPATPPLPAASITEVFKQPISGSGTYGSIFFTGISLQPGDVLVIAHSNNKNTSANTITLSGLGSNPIQSINSGFTGTTSSAWVFTSAITQGGVYSLALDTSNSTKTVSHATSVVVLRPVNGTLSVAASDTSVASSGATSLGLDLIPSVAVSGAYGVAAASMALSTINANPANWTQHADGNSKRRTLIQPSLSGAAFTPTLTAVAASDLALAGVVIRVTP
jgi:hypothetical protein